MQTEEPPAAHRAFTMIELVTVIVILGVMAVAVGAPTLGYVDSLRSQTAASRMLADIRYVQRYAMSSGLQTWITINVAGDSYQLYAEDPNNPGKANRVPLMHPLDQSTNAVQFGSGAFTNVGIAAANINATTELEFDSFGVPYDGNSTAMTADGTISLSNGVTLTVHQVSGFTEQPG